VLYFQFISREQEGRGAAPLASELVQGVLARSGAVFSGRIEYRQVVSSSGEEKPTLTKDEFFYFSGTSWAVFADGSSDPEEVSHRGVYVSHDATPQPGGWVGHTARAAVEEPINSKYPRLPVFAGTFWRQTTQAYVKKNINKAIDKGEAEVNGIATRVLEWAVSEAEKYEAFYGVDETTAQGGILRVYIAPQLGYALPRIDVLGTDGKLGDRYDSFDFFEVVPGIFFPKRCQWSYYDRSGKYGTSAFELKKIEKVNEPIPDDVFKIHLPVGTVVQDGRSGAGSEIFRIKEDGVLPVEGLDDVVQMDSRPPFWRRRPFAIGFGVTIGLLIVMAILFFKQRRRAKGSVQT